MLVRWTKPLMRFFHNQWMSGPLRECGRKSTNIRWLWNQLPYTSLKILKETRISFHLLAPCLGKYRRDGKLNARLFLRLEFTQNVGNVIERIVLHLFIEADWKHIWLFRAQIIGNELLALGPDLGSLLQRDL